MIWTNFATGRCRDAEQECSRRGQTFGLKPKLRSGSRARAGACSFFQDWGGYRMLCVPLVEHSWTILCYTCPRPRRTWHSSVHSLLSGRNFGYSPAVWPRREKSLLRISTPAGGKINQYRVVSTRFYLVTGIRDKNGENKSSRDLDSFRTIWLTDSTASQYNTETALCLGK